MQLALNSAARPFTLRRSLLLPIPPLADSVVAFPRKFTDQLQAFCEMADRLATTHDADAMLFLMERPTDWTRLRQATGQHTVLLSGDTPDSLEGANEEEFDTILLNIPSETPVYERLTQALLEAV